MASQSAYQQFKPALDYVEAELSAQTQVHHLAQAQGMQRTAFSRAFKKELALSPKEYLNRELNRLACDKLLGGSSPLKQIAAELQFSDEYSFSRFFKRMNATSPGRLRQQFTEKEI